MFWDPACSSILRTRPRAHYPMRTDLKRLVVLFAAVLAALPVLFASAAIPETKAVANGAAFLLSIQDPSGGYGASSAGQAFDSIFAVRSAGLDPSKDVVAGGKSPADYVKAQAAAQTKPAAAAKAALAAKAVGLDPKAVGGTNLIAAVTGGFDAATGKYASDDFSQSIAMLGLACTGNTVPAAASTALKATQLADGGWGFGGASDPDTTAIAIQALVAAGASKTDASVAKAITHLKGTIGVDGGWGFDPTASNASSTAYVVQALIAAGEDVNIPQYIRPGPSPVTFLLSQQNADGSFIGFDAVFATNQALPALAGRTFCNAPDTPITATRPAPTPSPSPTPAGPAPSTTPPAVPTSTVAAPLPPSTGNASTSNGTTGLFVAASAGFLLVAGAATVFSRRR